MNFLMRQHRSEAICLLLLGATAIALLVGSAALPGPVFDPLGPAGMPRYVAYLLLFFLATRIALLVREGKGAARGDTEPSLEARRDGKPLGAGERGIPRPQLIDIPQIVRLILASGITLAYLVALTIGGISFTWVTLVFLLALGASMTDLRPRNLITVAVIAVVMSFALTYTFTEILSVILPE